MILGFGIQEEIDRDDIPEKYRKYYYEIVHVFNENVECCGGCI